MTTKNILELIREREEYEEALYEPYNKKLERVFQILYEIKADIKITRIFRFSKESNFINISGVASLSEGDSVKDVTLKQDTDIQVSCTVPWNMLDDDSTPYEIVEIINIIGTLREELGPETFIKMMRSKDTNLDSLKPLIPTNYNASKPTKQTSNDSQYLSTFRMDGLTEEQKEKLKLYLMTAPR